MEYRIKELGQYQYFLPKKEVNLMAFKDLQPEDFPGLNLDLQKFEEWKKAKDDEGRNMLISYGLLVALLGILYLNTGNLYLPGLLLIIAINLLCLRKAKQLAKELGITPSIILEAQKRRKERL